MLNPVRWLFVVCVLVALAALPAVGQDNQVETGDAEGVDWSQPETIDPYEPGVGGFLDVEIAEYEKTAREAYDAKDYEKAAQYYLALLRYDINDGGNIYNLACCYGLLGEAELAAEYVERAFKAGFTDIGHIKHDPDFDKVRGEEVFDAAVEGLDALMQDKEAKLGKLAHFESPTLMKCRLQLPDDYDEAESYPLIVGLHGYGSNPDRFITLWEKFAGHDFIYASPQAPYAFSTGKEIGYSWDTWAEDDENVWEQSAEMTVEYVAQVTEELRARYSVSEVYLLGFSQGCAYTYMAGIANHELFDGLLCYGGWLNTEWLTEDALAAGSHLRVFIAHGNDDRMVEFEKGVESRDKLAELGYDVTFFEFDGAHRVPEESVHAAEEWMQE